MEYHEAERKAIDEMDAICDKLGIEWMKGGSDIRSEMFRAMRDTYTAGQERAEKKHQQETCAHVFFYNNHGGKCSRCGLTTTQCCSD